MCTCDKNSGSCGGVSGGLINTCQSKKLWNEEEDPGRGRRGDLWKPDDVEQGKKQVWRD